MSCTTSLAALSRCRAIQFTEDEARAIRIVTNEVHIYNPADFGAGIIDKLRLEGVTSFNVSPGRSPSLGLFVAEKKVRGQVRSRR